jgi:twitching motility protein PilT
VLRQDPDVVLVGEMRDMETIESALVLSETGHLTFGTLHTSDCVQTMNRMIDVFPAYQQQQVRTQLSFVLMAVFCQQLLAKADGRGRVLCAEIMVVNAAIRALIRDDKAHQIYSIIQTGGKAGMQTMNQALAEHYFKQKITFQEAMSHSLDPDDLRRLMQRHMSAAQQAA